MCCRYLVGGNPVTLRPIPEQQEEGKEVTRFLIEEKSNRYKIPKVFEETVEALEPEHIWQVQCPCHGILLLGLSETSKVLNRFIFLATLTHGPYVQIQDVKCFGQGPHVLC